VKRLVLVLGGARSGKSRYAEKLAEPYEGKRTFIATAEAIDAEFRERIFEHQKSRGADWITREAPLDLTEALAETRDFVLIDCLTVWIGNLMHHGFDVDAEIGKLCERLGTSKANIVIVSNEVGLGIVPDSSMARAFRDKQGLANQRLAAIADEVVLIAAGLPVILKKESRRRAPRPKARKARGGKVAGRGRYRGG
jgi:adenosylcobinamide kinase / adenosylcobinamide-phosphate guanylyltransferase